MRNIMMYHIYISADTHKHTVICMDIHINIQLYDYVCIWSGRETVRTGSCDGGAPARPAQDADPAESKSAAATRECPNE